MKETLEEAAEKYAESNQYDLEYYDEGGYQGIEVKSFAEKLVDFTNKWQQENYGLMEIELRHTKTLLASCEKALEERDKQQERYSEEEVHKIIESYQDIMENNPTHTKYNDWFEQHKKK